MSLPPGSMLIASGILKVDKSSLIQHDSPGINYHFDYGKLESFFQSINKQLFEAKCALQECVSEKMYKDEISQRLDLTRKVDGTLVDINMIKDIMFQDTFQPTVSTNSSAVLPSQKVNTTSDIKVLRGEIENLKMILRRMDLYHAEGIEVFSRLKRNEHDHRKLEDAFNQYRNSDLFGGIRGELQHLKDEVIKQLHDENKVMEKRVMHLEAKLQQMETNMKGDIGVKLTSLEERLDKLEEKTYEIEKEVMGEENDMAEGSDESDEEEKKGIVHQIFRSSSPSRHGSVSHNAPPQDEDEVGDLPIGLKHRYSIAALPADQRAKLLANYAQNQKQQSAPNLAAVGKRKSSRRFGGGFNFEELEGKYVDVETFQKFVAEAKSIRDDLLRFRLKMQCFECKTVTNVFNKYTVQKTIDCERRAFNKWLANINKTKEIEEDRKKRILQTFMEKIFHANTHHKGNDLFCRWKHVTKQMAVRDRIRGWVRNIAKHWLERIRPNLGQYLDRWKKFTVMAYRSSLLSDAEEEGGSIYHSRSPNRNKRDHDLFSNHRNENSDENDDILPIAIQMTGSGLNGSIGYGDNYVDGLSSSVSLQFPFSLEELKRFAYDDLQIQWRQQAKYAKQSKQHLELQENVQKQLDSFRQQNAIDDAVRNERVYSKLQKMEAAVQAAKQELKKALSFVDEEKDKIKDQTDQQLSQFTQQMNVFKSQIMGKFSNIKEEIQAEVDKVFANVKLHLSSVSELRDQLGKLTEWSNDIQEVTLKDILDRQKELNQQFQDIEKYMLVYRNKIDGLSEEILSITDRVRDTIEIAKDDSMKAKEFQLFYDEELEWMKTVVKETAKKVTEVKTNHESFTRETNDRFEAILNADADDTGFRADGTITDRFKDLLMSVKKHFITLSTWFEFFYSSNGSNGGTNMLELFQFPQMMKNVINESKDNYMAKEGTNVVGDNLKKWEEMKLFLSEELTKIARRIAHIIAVKGDQQILAYHITSELLQITPEGNGGALDNFPLLHMDRSSTIQIMDPLGQIHYCEKSSQNIRQHYLQMMHTLLHHYLNTVSAASKGAVVEQGPGSSNNANQNTRGSKNANSMESVKRREKFIEHFVKLIDTCLSVHPLMQQNGTMGVTSGGRGVCAIGVDATHSIAQGSSFFPSPNGAAGEEIGHSMRTRKSSLARRPSSAQAAMIHRSSSRTSMNQAALQTILAQSLSAQQMQLMRTASNSGFASPAISHHTGSNSAGNNALGTPQLQQLYPHMERGTLLNLNSVSHDFALDGVNTSFRPHASSKGYGMLGEMMSKVNEEATLTSTATIADSAGVPFGAISRDLSASQIVRHPSFHSSNRSTPPTAGTPLLRTISGHQTIQSGTMPAVGVVSTAMSSDSHSRSESFSGYLQRHQEVDREYEDVALNVSASNDEGEAAKHTQKLQSQQHVLSTSEAGKFELHINLSPSQRDRTKGRILSAGGSRKDNVGHTGFATPSNTKTNSSVTINSPLPIPNIHVGYASDVAPSIADVGGIMNLGSGSLDNVGVVPGMLMGSQTNSSVIFATNSNPNCVPEKFITSTIEKMQSISDNYHHFSEKTDSFESSPSKGYVIAHSAVPQQILVDSIVSNYPKDISIRPKHQEAPYEQLRSNDIGLVSRRLYGNHEA